VQRSTHRRVREEFKLQSRGGKRGREEKERGNENKNGVSLFRGRK
jgi:hypothetical protein